MIKKREVYITNSFTQEYEVQHKIMKMKLMRREWELIRL